MVGFIKKMYFRYFVCKHDDFVVLRQIPDYGNLDQAFDKRKCNACGREFYSDYYPVDLIEVESDDNLTLDSVYDKAGNWAVECLPDSEPVHHVLKLKQEADEVINDPADIIEYADCMIALMSAAYKSGFEPHELATAIHNKLLILRKRTWVKNEDGTHQHVED